MSSGIGVSSNFEEGQSGGLQVHGSHTISNSNQRGWHFILVLIDQK
jgi:hypothetical protein